MNMTDIIIALLVGSFVYQLVKSKLSDDAIYIGTAVILAAACIIDTLQRSLP